MAKQKGGRRVGSGRKSKNPFKFKDDIRYYLKEENIVSAVKVLTDKLVDKDRDSAKFILEQAFGTALPKDEQGDSKKKKTVLMLPPKDEDLQRMIDEGRIKIPKPKEEKP